MKRRILIYGLLMLFAISIILCIKLKSNNTLKVNDEFRLTESIEDKIISYFDKETSDSSYTPLSNLLSSGEWNEIDSPNNYDEWEKLENGSKSWIIKYSNDLDVGIYKAQNIGGVNFGKFDTSDGYFLNFNTAEWGGGLYLYPNGNKNKKYEVTSGYIWQVYKMNNKFYALASYPPKSSGNGKILEIKKSFGKWKSTEVINFNDTPMCFTLINSDTMYLVTNTKLLKLVNNKIVETIVDNAFWHGLSPNSIIYDNDYIYLGMRSGIAKVNLNSKEIKLYIPKT